MTTKHDDQHPGVIETQTVHDVHRRATSLLAEATAHAPIDALTEFRRFVIGMLRHHHHSEDTDLWPLLTDASPGLSAALDGLSQEHQLLDGALDELGDSALDEEGSRDQLRGSATDLRDLVHEHLSHEEPILLPALAEHISEPTWDQFSQRTVATSPPDGNHLMVALLDEVGTPEQVELVLRHVPPAAREQLPAMRARGSQALVVLRHRPVIGPTFADTDIRRVNAQVIDEFRANDGRVGGKFDSLPLLLLHSTGARSNREHVIPLLYQVDGERLVVFASNGGASTHPDWYHNALTHPDVSAELGPAIRPYRARRARRHEQQRLWSSVTSQFTPYAEYEAMTDREIPVVILEPRASSVP